MHAKYKVGDKVTIRAGSTPHTIESVKEQYYIGGHGWEDASDLTPYAARVKVGDQVRIYSHDVWYTVKAIHNESAWLWDDSGSYTTRPLYDIYRIRVGAKCDD